MEDFVDDFDGEFMDDGSSEENLEKDLDDGKESCVMIKDPEQYFNILSQNFDFGTYICTFPCLYVIGENSLQKLEFFFIKYEI